MFLTSRPHEMEQVDNRIQYGIKKALELQILKDGVPVIAVQGWRSGSNKTNTMRVLTVDANALGLVEKS